jgi:tryptophan synthase alpha chain
MGHQAFLNKLKQAGGVAFILPDLPVEEAEELHQMAQQFELCPILLMTPTNSDKRLQQLANSATGFVYTVARKGVTGRNTNMNNEVADFIHRCRDITDLPLAVGFGVSKKQDIAFVAQHADIAVIGTAALSAWEAGKETGLRAFLQQLIG